MNEGNVSPASQTGEKGMLVMRPPKNIGAHRVISFQNFRLPESLKFFIGHPGATIADCQRALGIINRSAPQDLELRKEVHDVVELLLFAGYLEKRYHRYFPTKKARSAGEACV